MCLMFFSVAVTETTSPTPVTEIGDGYGDPRAGSVVGGHRDGCVLQNSWVTRPVNVTELSTDVDASLAPPTHLSPHPQATTARPCPESVMPVTDAV